MGHKSNIIFDNFPDAVGAIDVSLIQTVRPKVNQKLFYSPKHHQHGIKLQALVTPDGLCIDARFGWPGSIHDKKVFDESGIAKALTFQETNPDRTVITKRLSCLFDRGYTGVKCPAYPEAIVTLRKPKNGELSENQLAFNRRVEHDRVIVENYFSRLRTICGIFAGKYRGERNNFMKSIVMICICLTNFYNSRHPMRVDNVNQRENAENSESDEE